MKNREPIVKELMDLSPLLAQSNPEVPFQVPQGYFEELPEKIISRLNTITESIPVFDEAKQNPYSIPQGYFENLADMVLKKIKAAETGSASLEIETLSPLLSTLNKEVPYSIPVGYFEELADNVAEGAKAIELVNEELENLSPLMSSLKGINVYEVPHEYFDSLATISLVKANLQKPAKVVSMSIRRRIIRYTAAAVVAGLIITSGWLNFNNNVVTKTGEDPVAKETQDKVKKVSDQELLSFIESADNSIDDTATPATATGEMDAADLKEMLADVSDEELQQYIEQSTPENNNSLSN